MTTITAAGITTALRAADIDHRVEHPGTIVATIIVTRADGREVAFGPARDDQGDVTGRGVDIAYYRDTTDGDVGSTDWLESIPALIADLRAFLG